MGGAPAIPPTLKGRARAQEKINADYGGDASQLVDIARSSIVFKTMRQVQAAMAKIGASAKIVRVKDRFQKPADGYRDVLFNLEMPNGHVVEMQIHLESIIKVKEGPGHALYEQQRSIESAAKIAGRPPTAAEKAQIAQLREKMKKLYDDAFSTAQ